MYLFINEWKKIWKKNYAPLFLFFIVTVSAAYFILTYQQTNPSQKEYLEQVFYLVPSDENPALWSEEDVVETGTYDSRDEDMINDLTRAINDPLGNFGMNYINARIGLEPYPQTGHDWAVDSTTLMTNLEQLAYFKENEIEPRQPLRIQQSAYDNQRVYNISDNLIGEDEERATLFADYHESRFDKGWYKIWQLLIDDIHLVLLAFIIIIFGGFLAIEQTKKRNHLNFLIVEGIKRPILYLTKLIVALLSGITFVLISIISILITSLFYNGFGSLKYPVLFHFFVENHHYTDMPDSFLHPFFTMTSYDLSLTSISLGDYLLESFILLVLILLFIFSLTFFVSIFINNEIVVSLIGVATISLHYILPITSYNPISYFSIHKVVSGEIRLIHDNNLMSFEHGVMVLLFWSLLFIIIGCIIYSVDWKKLRTGGIKP